jgi:hypothetical protein
MNRSSLLGVSALFLVACSGAGKASNADSPAPAATAATDARTTLELGRTV